MSNPYTKYEGYGPVTGREKMKRIKRIPHPDFPLDDYLATWEELPRDHDIDPDPALTDYLPVQDERRAIFVVRHAPQMRAFLKLYLAGDWNPAAIAALQALQFTSTGSELGFPLKSHVCITLDDIDGWKACGPVEITTKDSLPGKLYSRVMFRKDDDPSFIVGAYWCWPYQQTT